MHFFSFFFFKQKTAYEITHSDWSSDVCSSDLGSRPPPTPCSASAAGGCPSRRARPEIGRASCRERVLCVVEISGVGVSLEKKKEKKDLSYFNVSNISNRTRVKKKY